MTDIIYVKTYYWGDVERRGWVDWLDTNLDGDGIKLHQLNVQGNATGYAELTVYDRANFAAIERDYAPKYEGRGLYRLTYSNVTDWVVRADMLDNYDDDAYTEYGYDTQAEFAEARQDLQDLVDALDEFPVLDEQLYVDAENELLTECLDAYIIDEALGDLDGPINTSAAYEEAYECASAGLIELDFVCAGYDVSAEANERIKRAALS